MNKFSIESIVSKNVKYLRKQLGWSQELLAEKTGVSSPYITQIENGKRTPSLDIVEKLANALGIEYKTLFEDNIKDKLQNSQEYSNHILESRLISAITETIHNEFKG